MKPKSKKIISIILTFCIIISLVSVTGINANATIINEALVGKTGGTSGDYQYEVDEDGYARIDRYSGTDTNLVIPSTIDGYTVKYIGREYYIEDESITDTHITSVTIPDTVTEIGPGCFEYQRKLTTVNIPNSVKFIGENAFMECENLIDVTIPDGVEVIENEAFKGCKKITSIIIPDSVTKIGFDAFYDCNLNYVVLGKNVTEWGSGAFGGVKAIYVPKGTNKSFASVRRTYGGTIYYEGSEEEWMNTYTNIYKDDFEVHFNCSLENPAGFSTVVFNDFKLDLTYEKGNIQSGEIVLQEGTYEFNVQKGDVFNILDGKNIFGYNKTINDSTKGSLTCNPRYKTKTKLVATGGTYSFEFNTKTNALSVKRIGDIPDVYLTDVGVSDYEVINLVLKPVSGTSLSTGSVYLPDGRLKFKLINKGTELYGIESGFVIEMSSFEPLKVGTEGKHTPYLDSDGDMYTFTFDPKQTKFQLEK
ncbi:MAG: leucine-rich repeat domain-containing protein [Acutalibacteraceae bacterium]